MPGEHCLQYDSPSTGFATSLPLGNGRLGASVISSPASETFILNEITFWSGSKHVAGSGLRQPSQGPKQDLRMIQQCLLAGDYAQAETLSKTHLESQESNFGTNLPVGKLRVSMTGQENAATLERQLSLTNAVAESKYQQSGFTHRRRSFVSHPHQVLVVELETDDPSGLHAGISLAGENEAFTTRVDNGRIEFDAHALEAIHSSGRSGVQGCGVLVIQTESGNMTSQADAVHVDGCSKVVILLAFNTDYRAIGNEWRQAARQTVDRASALPLADLRTSHIADHQGLYLRMSLQLGQQGEKALQPTDHRRQAFRSTGFSDVGLFELYFNYARYLAIAGNRADSPLPMHLQGLWNDGEACRMGWSCDYHLDINTQMNYFPLMACGLSDTTDPLVRYLRDLADAGSGAARACYDCKGWVAHVFSNIWGFADPGWDTTYGLNVSGGLWLASHLIEMYEYTLDDSFLKKCAYPILRGATEFFLEYMVQDPTTGWLLTGPSVSPENSFWVTKDGRKTEHHLSLAPTLDVALLRDAFAFCAFAAKHLGVDASFAGQLESALAKLPPFQVGKHGQLQEWLLDYEEAQPDHRHLSHTVALCRSSLISTRREPRLAEAVRVSLQRRQVRDDLEDIEFTAALIALNYARLKDGEEALAQLGHLIGDLSMDNLLSFSKPGVAGAETSIFVADGNFGGAAAIGELLLRSTIRTPGGPVEIDLLPALPALWTHGKIEGLRGRGNVVVDIEWADGKLKEAMFTMSSQVSLRVYYDKYSRCLEGAGTARLDGILSFL